MITQEIFHHWKLEQDADHIVWLTLDKKDSSVNILNKVVLDELKIILESFKKDKNPKGLVIQSGKQNGFIAGADIQVFKSLSSEEEKIALIQEGQKLFGQLALLPFPTVALIKGFCLGGGLELALACRYRVAIIDETTKLGLPEVLLGLHPGWGGTVRLPKRVGSFKALDLMLTGKKVDATTAYNMGLVDSTVPNRYAVKAARYFMMNVPSERAIPKGEVLFKYQYSRKMVGHFFQKKLSLKVNRSHYPAPFAIIDLWVKQGVDEKTAQEAETRSFLKLAETSSAKNLIRVFELQEKLKKLGKPESDYKPHHVHVMGAGVMGSDIAALCALKGYKVTLYDQSRKAIANALKRAVDIFNKQLKEVYKIRRVKDRLIPDSENIGVKHADLIIEAIIENKEAKSNLFKMCEEKTRKETVLASNTSTIPLNELDSGLNQKERLIGIHFFNPVLKMALVEIATTDEMDPTILQKAMAFVLSLGKLPLPVKSSPGFLVNRVLMPYILEGILLFEEGLKASLVDKSAVEFGMPMGPLELADFIGLDVCLSASENLIHHFGGVIPKTLQTLVSNHRLGKKTGRGFYEYDKGKLIKEKIKTHIRLPEDIMDRLILRLLNEAVLCLREKIVQDADCLDAALIFGIGFPAFRGGPIQYIVEQGEVLLIQKLNLLSQRYGKRFLPDPGWSSLSSHL